jgi:uncharacterized protein
MESPVKLWRNQKYNKDLLGKKGVIVSWTIIRVPPSGYETQAPYPVVLILLESKKIICCQLADWDGNNALKNLPVQLIIRRIQSPSTEGIIPYGIKALVIEESGK